MIEFAQAKKIILDHCPGLGEEKRPVEISLSYTLARDAVARDPSPLFDNSAMDGFAVLTEDVKQASPANPVSLVLAGTIQAGEGSSIYLERGKTVKIFTGAPVPPNTGAVVMKEHTEETNNKILIKHPPRLGENIRKKGEEFKTGDVIHSKGTLITPPVLGMLASLGYPEISVYRKPKVAVLVTGNELVNPGENLHPGQIRDSNSYVMSAALEAMNIIPVEVKRVRDDKELLREAFSQALQNADAVISVGGISMGDYDLVKSTVESLGASTIFWKVAMKPGKPNYFGILKDKLIFGLPGNPVSAAVSFHTLVRPALLKMSGREEQREPLLRARLLNPVRKRPGRLEFLRGKFYTDASNQIVVGSEKSQGSHMLSGLAKSNCLIHLPAGKTDFCAGEMVEIQPLNWSIL